MAGLIPTADPYVYIEEQEPGYVRYQAQDPETGEVVRRWEVRGFCDRRGDCLVGAVLRGPDGGRVRVRSRAHLAELVAAWGKERLDSELDVPVTPEFDICCGADIFDYTELPLGEP